MTITTRVLLKEPQMQFQLVSANTVRKSAWGRSLGKRHNKPPQVLGVQEL
eukprot:m.691584 g.691584  ORF g.691584 m.691584 type:complete len:50 (-) comp22855_c0_seq21:2897-3046(-)